MFTVYNTNSYWATFRSNLIQDGLGQCGRASAVSAASPIVTGIIALMLQLYPQLDAAMVKSVLQKSARADSFTGTVPNPQWGYGKVDAYSALAMVASTVPAFTLTPIATQPVQLQLQPAVSGSKYVLQVSTDLFSWLPIVTNSASTNAVLLQDNGTTSKTRFYRAARVF